MQPDAHLPLCRPDQIRFYGLGQIPEMTGERSFIVVVADAGRTACNLTGRPAVTLGSGSTPLRFVYSYGGGPYLDPTSPTFVTLRPNDQPTAYVKIAKYRCDTGDDQTATSARVRLMGGAPAWDIDLTRFPEMATCRRAPVGGGDASFTAGMTVYVSSWEYLSGELPPILSTKMTVS